MPISRVAVLRSIQSLAVFSAVAAVMVLSPVAGSRDSAEAASRSKADRLLAFQSDAELKRFLRKRIPKEPPPPPAPPPPPVMAMDSVSASPVTAEKSAGTSDSITNVQTAGVDEGDIVKKRGDILVILRRGRLFTVSTAHGEMKAVDSINAYPPGVDARNDWYDEMLVTGNRVVVIGYSYGRGGTEINRFDFDAAGHLKFVDAYQLRSNDYYSSRNYASRLVGSKLVFYAPYYISYGDNPRDVLPALRRWDGNAKKGFSSIVSARHIFIPPSLLESSTVEAVHTVTTCDLLDPVLSCSATGVFGPSGRVFYVSQKAVYIWATTWWTDNKGRSKPSLLYRLPLSGGEPSAIGVRGAPVDQFSFREDAADNVLNVLVRAEGAGDAMWNSDFTGGAVALLRLPLSSFGGGTRESPVDRYRVLPKPVRETWAFQNRFVGNYVLYGMGNDWGTPEDRGSTLYVAGLRSAVTTPIKLDFPVDRIEVMGPNAVVIGSNSDTLNFTAITLTGSKPVRGDHYGLKSAVQGETRSHGFFFKPSTSDASSGVLGLPIARPGRPGFYQLFQNSAGIVFLRFDSAAFKRLGELDANAESARDDKCVASCVDWYGNARPIFAGTRTFALMGYELVEGDIGDGTIRETGRLNFAPGTAKPVD